MSKKEVFLRTLQQKKKEEEGFTFHAVE